MRTIKKTALAALLGTALVAAPGMADANRWGGYPRPYYGYGHGHGHYYGPPAPLVALGIAGAVLGTVAIVDSIVRPRVYVAPPYGPYDDAYRSGYERGRQDAYDSRPDDD